MTVTIAVDRRTCVGSGMCVFAAPGAFVLGEDRKVQVLDPVRADEEELLDAEESCPVSAIHLGGAVDEEVE